MVAKVNEDEGLIFPAFFLPVARTPLM